MLKSSKKATLPKQVKVLLDNAGFSWAWNESQGPHCKPDDFRGMLESRLRNQEIRVWLTGVEKSSTLSFIRD